MPMDWNQDPLLQRLEEKLDRVLEHLERESKTTHSIPKLFSFEECKEVLQCSDRTLRYYLFESYKHKLPYLKLGHMQSREIYTIRLKTEMMSPTIKINETVNAVRVSEIKHDGLYVSINEINGEEVMWIKRLFINEDNESFIARCDNPNHPEMIISSEILKRNKLNLRVFSVMQTIDRI